MSFNTGAKALTKASISNPKIEKYQAQAAGSLALKTDPSGASRVNVLKVPPSTGLSGFIIHLNATLIAEIV